MEGNKCQPFFTYRDGELALSGPFEESLQPSLPTSFKGFTYEGDAALGWFNANQSSYPNSQTSKGLIFDNVDLRHQVFTERVGVDLSCQRDP